MGTADVVPGVSGGTLALITGIYEELINTLGGITPRLLVVWRQQGFVAVWQQANLTFLFTLLAGIFTSIAVLARLITWLLETHPVPIWAF
ncbi:undecaprenyl phosphate translocase family protein, partial [Salmonella sp. s51884]